MKTKQPPAGPHAQDMTVDLLVIGSGTGMAAALSAHERGLKVLVAEKQQWVGGSMSLSGGAFWVPANPVLQEEGSDDTAERGLEYLDALAGDDAPRAQRLAFIEHGPATVEMLRRTTPLTFFWGKGYPDYHPEAPGGSAIGRGCESRPFDVASLGRERARLLPNNVMAAPAVMPVTSGDYKWMNLMTRRPGKALPLIVRRLLLGVSGMLIGREYKATGQALGAGLYAGLLKAGIPVWTRTALVGLRTEDGRVTGAVLQQDGRRVTVTARRGVILAAGGFDHNMPLRSEHQTTRTEDWSWGAAGNTGDAIRLATELGAATDLMDEAWWFPAFRPADSTAAPAVLLAERSLPGSFMVGSAGERFVNECGDYMTVGQVWQQRDRVGEPLGRVWLVFDQTHRNRYLMAGSVYPRQKLPQAWFDAGIAFRADDPAALARAAGIAQDSFVATFRRYNEIAAAGHDPEFGRGESAYDRYYGDPTVKPNPNLRPLHGTLYAVEVVLTDLGTCGGLRTDEHGQVQRTDGTTIEGLYAIGNTSANVFGRSYPGPGATIGQGLVYGHIAAQHAASHDHSSTGRTQQPEASS
ncbi:3-ketosteroid-delta-1-dehydrogenase [Streptomyces sp. NPDC090075]|uniref:3-ketosteroid-delta-1-dehydrogenase n=1 Tax=Streptomyces sp. NPDC090075 TaxID=3365937 RepID=UPI0037F7C09C